MMQWSMVFSGVPLFLWCFHITECLFAGDMDSTIDFKSSGGWCRGVHPAVAATVGEVMLQSLVHGKITLLTRGPPG
jgi:hypothetical protein